MMQTIIFGILLNQIGLYVGAYVLHFSQGEWFGFPVYLTCVALFITGFILVVFGIKNINWE